MAIEETIAVGVSGLGDVSALADALDKAAASAARLDEAAGKGFSSGGAGGADKLAASMDAAAAKIDASVGKIQAAFERLSGVGDSAAAGLSAVSAAADSAAGPLDAIAVSADEAAAATDRLAESADVSGAALDKQAAAGGRAAKSSEAAAAGAGAHGGKLKELALGAALTLGYAVDKAIKFDAQMTLLQTQAGVSASQMKPLTEGVLKLAGATGQDPGNLAESLYHVASNMESMPGTTTAKMLDAVKVAAEGAATGHSNLVDTTTALTSVLASGIPGAKDYSQAMGTLNATVGVGEMSMQDLAEATSTGVIPVVKGYGLNLKDVGAALATYGDLNIRGAKAGTELRMAVQALAVPAASAKKELAGLGLTTSSLAKDMQEGGLNKALEDLNRRFRENGITAKNEGQVITDLFGKKAGAGLALLLENMDRVESKYPALSKGANDFGKAWDATLQTPQQKLKQLEAGAKAMTITFGDIAMPAASAIMGGLDKAMSWVQGHAFASKGLTVGLGALIAGGLAKGIFSGVESGLQGLGKIGSLLHIPGMGKLATAGQDSGKVAGSAAAATGLDAVATAANGAAEALGRIAAEGGVPGVPGAKVPGEKVPVPPEEAPPGLFKRLAVPLGEAAPVAALFGVSLAGQHLNPHDYQRQLTSLQKTNKPSQEMPVLGPLKKDLIDSWALPLLAGLGAASTGLGRQFSAAGSYVSGGVTHDLHDIGSFFGIGGAPTRGSAQTLAPVPAESQMPHMYAAAGHMGTMTGGPPVKIPAPDLSAVEGATAKAKNALNTLGNVSVKPVKIPPPDTSAITAASAKVKGDMTALSSMHINPLRMPPADLSALDQAKSKTAADMTGITGAMAAAAGPARAAGAAVAAGMAGAISAGTGAAVAAAHQLASEVEAALNVSLQVHSPSKVSEHTGEEFAAGLASGITKHKGKAKSAAIDLSASTVNSLITGLQGGQSAVDAAMAALGSPAKPQDITTIESTVAKLKTDLAAALKKGDISKPEDSALTRMLDKDNQKLQRLAAQRTKLETEIASAQQLGQGAISEASILNAGQAQPTESITAQASSQTVQGMQYQAQQQSQFASQLAQLQKQGLNAQSISQLAQGGAAAGLPVTEGLVGNKQAIQQINQSEKTILAAAGSIGNTGAPAMYQAGQQVASQLGKGLQGQLKAVDSQMKSVAHGMVSAVEAGLNGKGLKAAMAADGASAGQGFASGLQSEIPAASAAGAALAQAAEAAAKAQLQSHSPSLVFKRVGYSVPEGFAQGIGDGAGLVSAAVGRMASGAGAHPAMMHPYGGTGGGTPSVGGFGGGGAPQEIHHHYHSVTVMGSVVTERELFNGMQSQQQERLNNNWRGGWAQPYKGM